MRLEAGQRFAPTTVRVTAETQARCLRAVGLEPDSFGAAAAPPMLGNEAYRALRAAGVSIDGWIETDVHFDQAEPAPLEQALALEFQVTERKPHPRGWKLRFLFAFARPGGEPLLRFAMGAIQSEPREAPARPAREEEDARAGLERARSVQLTPQRVLDFSSYVGNEIHLDPAFARRQGFRAPVAQGLMTTTLMTGALQATRPYRRLDARVRYLRPVFWDDAAELWRDGAWRRLRVFAGGRLAAEGEIGEAA